MSFEQFFSHPFLKVAAETGALHKGDEERAERLIQRARDCEGRERVDEAFRLYCEALNHLLPVLQRKFGFDVFFPRSFSSGTVFLGDFYLTVLVISTLTDETDSGKRQKLQEKVNDYVDRAEELKKLLSLTCRSRSGSTSSEQPPCVSSSQVGATPFEELSESSLAGMENWLRPLKSLRLNCARAEGNFLTGFCRSLCYRKPGEHDPQPESGSANWDRGCPIRCRGSIRHCL